MSAIKCACDVWAVALKVCRLPVVCVWQRAGGVNPSRNSIYCSLSLSLSIVCRSSFIGRDANRKRTTRKIRTTSKNNNFLRCLARNIPFIWNGLRRHAEIIQHNTVSTSNTHSYVHTLSWVVSTSPALLFRLCVCVALDRQGWMNARTSSSKKKNNFVLLNRIFRRRESYYDAPFATRINDNQRSWWRWKRRAARGVTLIETGFAAAFFRMQFFFLRLFRFCFLFLLPFFSQCFHSEEEWPCARVWYNTSIIARVRTRQTHILSRYAIVTEFCFLRAFFPLFCSVHSLSPWVCRSGVFLVCRWRFRIYFESICLGGSRASERALHTVHAIETFTCSRHVSWRLTVARRSRGT